MFFRKKIWILLLVFSSIGLPIKGQTPNFFHHKIIKGIKGYQSQVILQDHLGLIWFGTSEGLILFDGVDYIHFTEDDSLGGKSVTALCQAPDGTLWIGHKNGSITLLKDQQFSKFSPEEGLGTIAITDLIADSSGTIWFSTIGEGIYYYMNDRLYNLNTDDNLADNYVYCLEIGPHGKLWIGTDFGISIYDLKKKEFQNISMSDGIPDNIVKKIVHDKKGKIWVGTYDAGIFYIDPLTYQPVLLNHWTYGSINDFIINQNELWVSTTRSGVVQMIINENNTARNKLITTKHGLYSNLTQSIFLDREKNLWIGTEDGVDQSVTSVFELLDQRHGLPFLMVYDFLIDENNIYWVCSEKGIYKLTESVDGEFDLQNCFSGTSLENYHFISLYPDENSYIWAGTYDNGVVRINPTTLEFEQFTTVNGLSDNNVISITATQEKVYLSTLGGGVSVCDIGQSQMIFKNLTKDDPNISNYIYSTYIDSRERIWFAEAGNQLHFMYGDSLTSFGPEDGLNFNTVYSYTEDKQQNIYFSTEKNGMYCYNGEQFIHYDESNGMASSEILSIMADAYNNILIVSNEGIDLFHPESKSFTHFGENYGVAYLEPQLNSIFQDKQGDIWIGTGNGLIKYHPEFLFQDTIQPLLFLSGIELYSTPVEKGMTRFTHRQNNFTFQFTGLWYRDPGRIRYRFQLQGYDREWSVPNAIRSMTYPMIPPGIYTFNVQVSLDGSSWQEAEDASFTFTIKPPFWRTVWFITASFIVILLLILTIFRIRLAALKNQKEVLQREVLKATEEIRNQNKELESQKNEIEQQKIEITDSIHYAGRIQNALLPPEEDLDRLLPSYFILYIPMDIVSGDYYWVSHKDNKVIVAVADATGHGVPGAFMSLLGITFLNEIVNKAERLMPNEILNELREQLIKSLHQTGKIDETREGMEIALCVFDPDNKKLQYSGAFRPLYLIRNKELNEFKGDHMPIGIYDDKENSFSNKEMHYEENDIIYLFSDGYVDQIGGPNRKTFRSRKFKQLLINIHQKPLREQKEILEKEYEEWRQDIEQIDDIMVMGIRFTKV